MAAKMYQWVDDGHGQIKTKRTEIVEETFNLVDLATEWEQLKAWAEKLIENRAAFKVKVSKICTDLGLTKDQLIGLTDLEAEE